MTIVLAFVFQGEFFETKAIAVWRHKGAWFWNKVFSKFYSTFTQFCVKAWVCTAFVYDDTWVGNFVGNQTQEQAVRANRAGVRSQPNMWPMSLTRVCQPGSSCVGDVGQEEQAGCFLVCFCFLCRVSFQQVSCKQYRLQGSMTSIFKILSNASILARVRIRFDDVKITIHSIKTAPKNAQNNPTSNLEVCKRGINTK